MRNMFLWAMRAAIAATLAGFAGALPSNAQSPNPPFPKAGETYSEPAETTDAPAAIAHRATLSFEGLGDLTIHIVRPATLAPEGHRVILYFVGGGQEEADVQHIMNSHIAREAVSRGFIFISPVAPCYSCTFVASGEDYFPGLFEKLSELLPMSEERFHLMGFSNGGRSSLHIGTRHPEWVASITAYPGYLRNEKYELLERLSNTCVIMYVGSRDPAFLKRHRRTVGRLKGYGHPVHSKIYTGRTHSIRNLWTEKGAELLMDGIENRLGCPA
ncbi:dienelactone hydrolase family protein [Hyphococcus sp.]|uniref:dienelactone hydrolase family protein n=1 Tax=Hyphococcus sp. TaxID=2038636 RepID=UPI003D107960